MEQRLFLTSQGFVSSAQLEAVWIVMFLPFDQCHYIFQGGVRVEGWFIYPFPKG